MKAIQITKGEKIVKKSSNRFSNRDFNLLDALAWKKGFKLSKATKTIIIGSDSFKLLKKNGYIYAGDRCLSQLIDSNIISASKFLNRLQAIN